MAEKWTISGEYFESCNCDLICACLVQAPTPRDRCDAALAFHIAQFAEGGQCREDDKAHCRAEECSVSKRNDSIH